MNRYLFEFLAFIEHKNITYNISNISDSIKISGTMIMKLINESLENELISLEDDIIKLTQKGVDCLEPYRVKKAVIMAAGFGNRITPATIDRH